jgi:hypothetical protein
MVINVISDAHSTPSQRDDLTTVVFDCDTGLPCKFDLCMTCFGNLRNQGQVSIPSSVPEAKAAAPIMPARPSGRHLLSSHHNTRISFNDSSLNASPNKAGWEVWHISDCGNGKVCLTAHNGQQLSVDGERLNMSPNKGGWEQWTLAPVGNGKYYIVAHTGNHLGMADNGDLYCKNRNTGGWEHWDVVPA